jgi:hypothetical protein
MKPTNVSPFAIPCGICKTPFIRTSNFAKYCAVCAPLAKGLVNVRSSMGQRCRQNIYYSSVRICEEWRSTAVFIRWALANGYKPGLHLDRENPDGDYCPTNCRWVTQKENNRNKRNKLTDWDKGTRLCTGCGEEKPIDQFVASKNRPCGHDYKCRACESSYRKNLRRRKCLKKNSK